MIVVKSLYRYILYILLFVFCLSGELCSFVSGL